MNDKPDRQRMKGRTVLVTGATDGIGKETALGLAAMGATVLVHGRDGARCRTVVDDIRRLTGKTDAETFVADLSSQQQIRRLASDIHEQHGGLHVLINNAGVYVPSRQTTGEGLEMTFAVNHVAPFLLTHLLIDLLKAGAPARIVNVSSTSHTQARLDFDNLQGEKKYHPYGAYALSKLGNVFFTYEIAKRLEGTGVTANCLHPGVIDTKLLRAGFPSLTGAAVPDGAATSIYVASAFNVEGVTGRYFVKKKEEPSSPLSHDRAVRKQFWDVTARLCHCDPDTAFS